MTREEIKFEIYKPTLNKWQKKLTTCSTKDCLIEPAKILIHIIDTVHTVENTGGGG